MISWFLKAMLGFSGKISTIQTLLLWYLLLCPWDHVTVGSVQCSAVYFDTFSHSHQKKLFAKQTFTFSIKSNNIPKFVACFLNVLMDKQNLTCYKKVGVAYTCVFTVVWFNQIIFGMLAATRSRNFSGSCSYSLEAILLQIYWQLTMIKIQNWFQSNSLELQAGKP